MCRFPWRTTLVKHIGIFGHAVVSMVTLVVAESQGSTLPVTLPSLVGHSASIVLGTVTSIGNKTGELLEIRKPGFQKDLPFYTATIEIMRVIKGDASIRQVEVYYTDLVGARAALKLHEKAIFFLTSNNDIKGSWKGKLTVAYGTRGEVLIDGDHVTTKEIEGEPKKQKLDDFIRKIEQVLASKR